MVDSKGTFLYFTQTGNMSTEVVCDKLCTYNVITRTKTKKCIQRNILKNTMGKSKWNCNRS